MSGQTVHSWRKLSCFLFFGFQPKGKYDGPITAAMKKLKAVKAESTMKTTWLRKAGSDECGGSHIELR